MSSILCSSKITHSRTFVVSGYCIFWQIENRLPFRNTWGSSWSWSYSSWMYNYRCNRCLSSLVLWIWIPHRKGVFDTTICDKVYQWLAIVRWYLPGTPVSSTNKTDRHDITELLFKVALNTITVTPAPDHLSSSPVHSSVRVARSLVYRIVFLVVLFMLSIVCSVLWCTVSDPFDIFKCFILQVTKNQTLYKLNSKTSDPASNTSILYYCVLFMIYIVASPCSLFLWVYNPAVYVIDYCKTCS